MTDDNRSMTVVVEFQIRTETTSLDEWLDEWQKRADDAYQYEPETLAYEAAVNLEDESRVLIFERYENGLASLNKHVERPAHSVLQENMGARRMTKRRLFGNVGADVPDYGWWARREVASPARTAGYRLTLLAMRFAQSTQCDKFIELSREHARYCHIEEPDTLVYSGAIARNDAKPDSAVLKGDLMFVMGCTDEAAEEKHAVDPNHVALGAKLTGQGVEIENSKLLQYRTTGRGYLWR